MHARARKLATFDAADCKRQHEAFPRMALSRIMTVLDTVA